MKCTSLQTYPKLGYLYRRVHLQVSTTDVGKTDDVWDLLDEEDDPAAVKATKNSTITIDEYIVFSATYQVPAFSFNAYSPGARSSPTQFLVSRLKLEFIHQKGHH